MRVQIVDGRIVVDESSLRITAAPTTNSAADEAISNGRGARSKRVHCEPWSLRETDKFYDVFLSEKLVIYQAVKLFGTNFDLIARYLGDTRTRKQVKSKFKREEKFDRWRLDRTLKSQAQMGLTRIRALDTLRDFSIRDDIQC